MHAVEVHSTFCAAHALRLPGGELEPVHGHNFVVTVKVACAMLDALETVVDFHILLDSLESILSRWKNRNLNDVEPFRSRLNPSAERIAEEIGGQMEIALAGMPDSGARGVRVVEVRVTEAPNCLAIWSPG